MCCRTFTELNPEKSVQKVTPERNSGLCLVLFCSCFFHHTNPSLKNSWPHAITVSSCSIKSPEFLSFTFIPKSSQLIPLLIQLLMQGTTDLQSLPLSSWISRKKYPNCRQKTNVILQSFTIKPPEEAKAECMHLSLKSASFQSVTWPLGLQDKGNSCRTENKTKTHLVLAGAWGKHSCSSV